VHWLAYWLGLTNPSGSPYLFWSGAGANLAYLGLAIGALRYVNCDTPHCWRPGLRRVEGTDERVCRKHHPHLPDHGVVGDAVEAVVEVLKPEGNP
jgi:hypothetical protein